MADLAAELVRIPLFAGLDGDELDSIARTAFVRHLARGQILFSEGEPSDHLFLVRSGRLRVFLVSAHGEELVLSVCGPGDTLGELSVLDRAPRSATVDAMERTELIAISGDDARAVLEKNLHALRAVAIELAAGMRRLSGTAADLVFLDLPRRLAKLLLAEAVTGADGASESHSAMSQRGVAARLGVTRQSLNRALSALAQRNWITVEGATVHLDDPAALSRFAQS